jgi:ABC-type glycerol-3-phosphate transport system permease component
LAEQFISHHAITSSTADSLTLSDAAKPQYLTPKRRHAMRMQRLRTTLLYLVAIALAFITAFPLLWLLVTMFKPAYEIHAYPPTFFAKHYTLSNLLYALRPRFLRPFFNSMYVTLITTALQVVVNGLAGYALAKHRFPGRMIIFYLFLASMMVPFQIYLIPDFLIVKHLGLLDTRTSLIITWVGSASAVFLIRQYMLGLPDSALEAARLDGASELRIFFQIVMPMSAPVLGVVAIFSFFSQWNNLLLPLVLIHNPARYTLPLFLVFSPSNNPAHNLVAAFVTSIPPLIVFILLQRYFSQGIALTGTGEQ